MNSEEGGTGSSSPFVIGVPVLTTGETDTDRGTGALPLGRVDVLGTLDTGGGCTTGGRVGTGVIAGLPPAPTVVHPPPPGAT